MANTIFTLSPDTRRVVSELKTLMLSKKGITQLTYLQQPEVVIADLPEEEHRLGYYSPADNLIVLSSVLLPDMFRIERENVFLHELAHCVETFSKGRSGHGTAFRDICRSLGVVEGFDRAVCKVRDWSAIRKKAESKARKLMALSSSPFEAEAQSAFRKAQELGQQFSLDFLKEGNSNQLFGVHTEEFVRNPRWKGSLSVFISNITGAYPITCYTRGNKKAMFFYGSREQVESSLYLWNYFIDSFNKKYEENRYRLDRSDKTSFYINMLDTVEESFMKNDSDKSIVLSSKDKIRSTYIEISQAKVTKGRYYHCNNTVAGSTAGKSAGSSIKVPSMKKGTILRQITG